MRFRERGVRFVVGDAIAPDAETDQVFDEVCEILRLMGRASRNGSPVHFWK